MLERMHDRVLQGRFVEDGQVPHVEVDRPQWEGDQGMGEDAQAVEQLDPQDRRDQRPGQAEDDQQGRDVAEQQMLDHVRAQQLLAVATERGERRSDSDEARIEAGLAPAWHGSFLAPQGLHALGVGQAEQSKRPELEEGLQGRGCGERGHGHQQAYDVRGAQADDGDVPCSGRADRPLAGRP